MDHRVISPIEMYSVARDQVNFYKTVVWYLRFEFSSLSLSEWKSHIENALHLTIEAQPRLRLQVDLSRPPQAYYIILPMNIFDKLPIEIIERTTDNTDDEADEFLHQTLEGECNRGFIYNRNSPLWRVILIHSSNKNILDFIVTFHHAIGDGISGMAFFTTLVDCLSGKSTMNFPLKDDCPSYELIPSNLPPLSSMILQIIEKLLLPHRLSQYFFPKTYWAGSLRLMGNEPFHTRLISFKLPDTILDALHKKCRTERTTVHTAILSALLLSITEIFGKKDMEFICGTAVDVRRFCRPIISNKKIGVFVSGADSYHYIPYRENLLDFFWILARQIKEQITYGIDHEVLPLVQSLKFVSNWNDFLIKQRKTLPNGRQHSIDISNILQWSFESNNQSWKILHGGFTQSSNIVGSAFTTSVVTVNGILNVYICYQEHSVESIEQVKMMRDRMKQFLIEAITLENKY